MKPLKIHVKNFGSYKDFEMDLDDRGLLGVFGETKSGKSTLLDMVPWVLYGTDSKESNADDVRSWNCDEPTSGDCLIDTGTGLITVSRLRGGKKNDLYWKEEGSESEQRGKDLPETQKKIEARLASTAGLYVAGSYIHQFSAADRFFTATAKERRQSFEKIVDLSFPIKLVERATQARKEMNAAIKALDVQLADEVGQMRQLDATVTSLERSWSAWVIKHEEDLHQLSFKSSNFEAEKEAEQDRLVSDAEAVNSSIVTEQTFKDREKQVKDQMKQLEAVKLEFASLNEDHMTLVSAQSGIKDRLAKLTSGDGECEKCLGKIDKNHIKAVKEELSQELIEIEAAAIEVRGKMKVMEAGLKQGSSLNEQLVKIARDRAANEAKIVKYKDTKVKINALAQKINHYDTQLAELMQQENPHGRLLQEKKDLQANLSMDHLASEQEKAEVEHLLGVNQFSMDKAMEMRGVMAAQAIQRIETNTNKYLERFFESDLHISLTAKDADKIDADILNEGNPCPYNRLSGGERCMLKLAFSFSQMKQIEDTYGVKYELLMLDEALNGISPKIRKAAFHMLEALEGEYGTIMIIDHDPEFKSQFTHKLEVSREGQWSEVHEA